MIIAARPSVMMYLNPKPIPAHKLPPPFGTDPAYLKKLLDGAVEQMLLAHEDGWLPYWEYIETVKRQLRG
ncbi:hypothetical protein [Microbulbifer celer]|uniref:Uncharacterized protein n=1 Tax=Microbulbifer celer TaxID=435905 RepID=A0ABW3UBN5_9GAMM|nr:hypothetical protein [Microbulbifer celer]UFN57369.1 hypothetical protein LPW13_17655 [Microbulbifer celer]